MNGVHDLGGMHGFGPVRPEPDEPVFHTEWERRVFALTLAMGAWRRWNLDMGRFAREQMPPAEYLATSYYEHWLWGLEELLAEKGFLTSAEIARGRATPGDPAPGQSPAASEVPPRPAPVERAPIQPEALRADGVEPLLRNRRAARLADPVPPTFRPGDRVLARNVNPVGHTRIPRYVRGRHGVVARDHGVFIFPDTHALGLGQKPQHVYSIRFEARELWGHEASHKDSVYVDLWDDYLEIA
jgi:nitrile hydratase beta subunit